MECPLFWTPHFLWTLPKTAASGLVALFGGHAVLCSPDAENR